MHNFKKMLKKSTFLNQFGVQAVKLEKKIRKRAYTHFDNKWGSISKNKKLNEQFHGYICSKKVNFTHKWRF